MHHRGNPRGHGGVEIPIFSMTTELSDGLAQPRLLRPAAHRRGFHRTSLSLLAGCAALLALPGCQAPALLTPEQIAEREKITHDRNDPALREQMNKFVRDHLPPGRAVAGAVKTPPHPRLQPAPDYPFEERRLHHQALVWLCFVITATGDVAEVQTLPEDRDDPLSRAAKEAVRRWKFAPAQVDGRPVNTRVVDTIGFTLE